VAKRTLYISIDIQKIWEKQFDPRGVLTVETYYDDSDQIIIRSEGKFRIIPFGLSFIGFTIMAIIAIIGVSIIKRKLRINFL